jgi:translation elongation factor EF-Tu-like GTPase
VPDTRPRVSLNGKTIRLDQLATEVGAAMTASDSEVVIADPDSTVTTAALQAALDAHVPTPEPDPEDEFRKAVEAATSLDALKAALLGTKGPGAEPRRATAP